MDHHTTEQLGESTLAAYRDRYHLLLIFAPDEADPAYQQQQQWLEPQTSALEERDLLLFSLFADGESTIAGTQSSSPTPAELREEFDIAEDEFAVLLVGKDSTVKMHTDQPVEPQTLLGLVEQMPIRQAERQ
jgi:hypothetical protein